jgi:hypothetical protein
MAIPAHAIACGNFFLAGKRFMCNFSSASIILIPPEAPGFESGMEGPNRNFLLNQLDAASLKLSLM